MTTETKTYRLTPMPRLTFWTLFLVGLKLATIVVVIGGSFLMGALTDISPEADAAFDGAINAGSGLFFVLYIIAGIASLFWIYGAARNARALRPALDLTPGWAVGWYFVPFANLVKPCSVMADIWSSSKAAIDGRYPKTTPRVLVWWVLTLVAGICGRLSDMTEKMGDAEMFGIVVALISLVAMLIGDIFYFGLVREIHRDQSRGNVKIADAF